MLKKGWRDDRVAFREAVQFNYVIEKTGLLDIRIS
jgi:hypothetical protein